MRMIFNGLDNESVELKIHNYQFPESPDRQEDGNWLYIHLVIKSAQGHWQTIDPSLLTWEVESLVEWFHDLGKKAKPDCLQQEFIEPNISFHLLNSYLDDQKLIKIKFDLESRPGSAKDEIDYFVTFKADEKELHRIASELKQELQKFPVRK